MGCASTLLLLSGSGWPPFWYRRSRWGGSRSTTAREGEGDRTRGGGGRECRSAHGTPLVVLRTSVPVGWVSLPNAAAADNARPRRRAVERVVAKPAVRKGVRQTKNAGPHSQVSTQGKTGTASVGSEWAAYGQRGSQTTVALVFLSAGTDGTRQRCRLNSSWPWAP